MKQIKRFIVFIVHGKKILQAHSYAKEWRRIKAIGTDNIFAQIYEQNLWGCEESVSGAGSTIAATLNIRKEIPQIINRFGVKSILDAPCGDYNWFRLIGREKGLSYVGGDIVEALVTHNQEKFGNDHTRFLCLDIRHDELPNADLWICRDCLGHLSDNDVFKVIRNFHNSDAKYFLASTCVKCKKNLDIPTGSGRDLYLELPPFSFCKPILYINDYSFEGKQLALALWERRQLVNL
jgi:SAM-dependent methyltransferase